MEKLALISVSDKSGLLDFAKKLVYDFGYRILSTGGTATMLAQANLPVTEVSEHTGFPEMMEGRIKTLHPKIHGGLLCRRDQESHLSEAQKYHIEMIDLVVVNLYPFEETIAKPHCTLSDAIEKIDIGGPSMLRSAAKNYAAVTVLCDPTDYPKTLQAFRKSGDFQKDFRKHCALKVFQKTAHYDYAIAQYLEKSSSVESSLEDISGLPKQISLEFPKAQGLRYGENPHQQAALYGDFWSHYHQLQGKELSYNNLMDITAATYLIGEFQKPSIAILKHTNPCGVASGNTLLQAWDKAIATDRQSPFGGIIIANRTIDLEVATVIRELFCEVIIAPMFSDEARVTFGKKKNLRLLTTKEALGVDSLQEMRSVVGGLLLQDRDQKPFNPESFTVVTKRSPTSTEWKSLLFAWRVVRHVKSNAIVYAGEERTLGIGAGQMSRVDSSKIAVWKANQAGLSLCESVVASDAFFPFSDGLIAAADAGATAAIQPGGSIRDQEVIEAANEKNMAMIFTGMRHFRH